MIIDRVGKIAYNDTIVVHKIKRLDKITQDELNLQVNSFIRKTPVIAIQDVYNMHGRMISSARILDTYA
jgi:hypothetical protein